MSREWKPGDVALVEAGCWANRKVALRLAEGWSHINGVSLDSVGLVSPVRPLVVIDPEDREQAERLAELYDDSASGTFVDRMQAALREFADPKPPKPEEPQGLGAVVEDAGGSIWVRLANYAAAPWHTSGPTNAVTSSRVSSWAVIDVVRVLSDGWAGEDR